MYAQALDNDFAREVRAGLTRTEQKTLPCRYFYDAVGSALFEAITALPEYGLTRADACIMQVNAKAIAASMPGRPLVVELGSGSGAKTRGLLEQWDGVTYFPIDVSAAALSQCTREMAGVAEVRPLETSYFEGLREAAAYRQPGQAVLALFLGSTIGNFERAAAEEFLYGIRAELAPGDALLLGTDLVKPVGKLLDAYDDPTGVNAAFNLNLLGRINRELDANFDLRRFEHLVRYNGAAQRIEMHLLSLANQCVRIRSAEFSVSLQAGETIHTESCHKFRLEEIAAFARMGGFALKAQWTEEQWGFAESLLVVH